VGSLFGDSSSTIIFIVIICGVGAGIASYFLFFKKGSKTHHAETGHYTLRCKKCGEGLKADSKFCKRCGNKIRAKRK